MRVILEKDKDGAARSVPLLPGNPTTVNLTHTSHVEPFHLHVFDVLSSLLHLILMSNILRFVSGSVTAK